MLFHLVFGKHHTECLSIDLPTLLYKVPCACLCSPELLYNPACQRLQHGLDLGSYSLWEIGKSCRKKNPPRNSYSVVPIVKGGLGVDSHSKVSWHENEERNMNTCKAFFVRSTVDISCVIRVHASTEALNFTIGQGAANTKAVDSARC